MEDIKIYQGNTVNIQGTITSGLSDVTGYTGHLIAKENSSDTSNVIDVSTSTWDSSTALFSLSETDTSVAGGKYVYEFYVDSSQNLFTVGIGDLYVVDALSK